MPVNYLFDADTIFCLLKQYFPLIREREEVLMDIRGKQELQIMFEGWSRERRDEFLDFCTGVRGVKLLYDSFFKEIVLRELVSQSVFVDLK